MGDALRVFWFFEPRMALWGLGLGTFLGAMYGSILGAAIFPAFPPSLLFGPLLGGGYGAVAGLALGIMEGAVLWAFTLLFQRRSKPGDTGWYLRAAGYVCAGACLLAPVLCLELVVRADGTSLMTGEYDSSDVIMALVMLLVPTLIAACAVWWTVTKVAKQYVKKFGEQPKHRFEQATYESPAETSNPSRDDS
jgi:hypothetical protein